MRLILFPLLLVFGFCSTPPPVKKPSKTAVLSPHPRIIDLNLIQLTAPVDKSIRTIGPEEIPIYENDKGEGYLFLNFKFAGSGLNVIEMIKKGEIVDHNIIIRDSHGEIIGKEPINFTAFTKTETITIQQGLVVTEDSVRNPLPEVQKKMVKDASFAPVIYSDKDEVPQTISFLKGKREPVDGDWISINLELKYLNPFFHEYCYEENNNCTSTRENLFNDLSKATQKKLQEKINYSPNESRQSKPVPNDLPISSVQENVNVLNKGLNLPDGRSIGSQREKVIDPTSTGSYADGFGLYYREWNLVSVPKYFRIRGKLDKNGRFPGSREDRKIQSPPKSVEVEGEDHPQDHHDEDKKDPRKKRKAISLP